MMKLDTSLYFITDSTGFSEEEFLRRTQAALQGGVTLLQIREKNRTTREYMSLAEKVHALALPYGVPLLIDDRLDVAMAIDAEGVHLGQSDLPIAIARRILGQGADYLGVGAIYPTTTKVKTVLTSTDTLRDICKAVPIAVNAIGGLNRDNIDVLQGTGIAGICVVSAIMKAADPRQAALDLRARAEQLHIL